MLTDILRKNQFTQQQLKQNNKRIYIKQGNNTSFVNASTGRNVFED